MTKTIYILAKSQVGVLVRITGLLLRFGVTPKGMMVEENKQKEVYSIRINVNCEDRMIEQIKKLIEQQIDVLYVNSP